MITCHVCDGYIFPYTKLDPEHCKCMPDDYEQCGECGFDHSYEWNAANKVHSALQEEQKKVTIPAPDSMPTLEAFHVPGLPPGYTVNY